MLVLHAKNIKKYYGDRLILDVPDFKIYSEDRIGLIGTNGCGKTTLLDILTEKIKPDEGTLQINSSLSYVTQLGNEDMEEYLSGGEITKAKVFDAISVNPGIFIADEPTANLDRDSVVKTENLIKKLMGAVIIVSHDRAFLNTICNKILKLENGRIIIYHGNYTSYSQQVELDKITRQKEYEKYKYEKRHLEEAVSGMVSAEKQVRKTPKRMGNSEARLHKRSSTEVRQHLAKHRKGFQTRLDKLDVKEKPKEAQILRIYHQGVRLPVSKTALELDILGLQAGGKLLINDIKLIVPTGKKIALTGSNGAGKTTLLNHIRANGSGVRIAPGSRVAFFNQKLDNMDDNLSLIGNIMLHSTLDQGLVRTVLASMLFTEDDIFKSASVLSGGERVKLQLASTLLSGADFLILDEVTNYLDIGAIDALERLMTEFPGTILYVSHDRMLVENTADRIYEIKDMKLIDATYRKQIGENINPTDILTDMRLSELSVLLGRGDINEEELIKARAEYADLILKKQNAAKMY